MILRSGPGKRPRERGRAAGEEKLLGGGSAAPYLFHAVARSLRSLRTARAHAMRARRAAANGAGQWGGGGEERASS